MLPGQTLRYTLTLSGAATGTPTAKLLRNGVNDGAVSPTVAAGADSNEWLISAAIPSSGYVVGDTVEFSATATVSGVTQSIAVGRTAIDNIVSVLLDGGTVAGSPAPTATTFSSTSTTLTATASGAYAGSQILFQSTGSLGRVHRVVAAHTVVPGSPNRHDFTLTTTTGTTPVVGPASGDTFFFG